MQIKIPKESLALYLLVTFLYFVHLPLLLFSSHYFFFCVAILV